MIQLTDTGGNTTHLFDFVIFLMDDRSHIFSEGEVCHYEPGTYICNGNVYFNAICWSGVVRVERGPDVAILYILTDVHST